MSDTATNGTEVAASGYTPMGEQGRANVQSIIDSLDRIGRAIGGWTDKVECRQTGASYHAKFERKVDVFTTKEWAEQLAQCPALLIDACRKLLAADAHIATLTTPEPTT